MGINDFSLVLGCSGCKYNDLVLCSGTFNLIIDFAGHFEPEKSKQIMDFLDYTCELFDYPMGDWNKITNTLKILYDNFKDISNVRCLEFRKRIGQVMSLLNRSRRSIIWQYKHMFKTCEWDRSKNLFNLMAKVTV